MSLATAPRATALPAPAANRLSPLDCLDPAILATERIRIFDTAWHLVGLARDWPAADDWRLATIAGREVIVQRFGDGMLGAFSNVCPHRFGQLRQAASGNGKLRCMYHLWSFDADGVADAVPLRGAIPLDRCQGEALSLERWAVDRCGDLIFVALKPAAPLGRFLGPLAETLARMSAGFGQETDRFEQDIAANWKIILQNTVEFDHAFGVHPETFAPMVARPVALEELPAAEPHIAYRAPMRQAAAKHPAERRIRDMLGRTALPPVSGYLHYTLFPSATIGTTDNRQLAIVTYQPVAAGVTRAEYRLFAPSLPPLNAVEQAILDRVLPADVAFTRRLLEEDRRVCEAVQRGMANAPASMTGCLMPGERLVGRFQDYWRHAMDRAD